MNTNLIKASLVAFVAMGAMSAQSSDPVRVNVPFNFSVEGQTFQAGEYIVSSMQFGGRMMIRSTEDKGSGSIAVTPLEWTPTPDSARLVFHRYGNTYFLAEVWTPAGGRRVPLSKTERQVASRQGNAVIIAVR